MKNKNIAAVLAFFLGGLGAHKFYLGKTGQGILYLVFVWTFIPAFIALIDMLILLCMSDEEFDRKYNQTEIARQSPQSYGQPSYNNQSSNNAQSYCPNCGALNSRDNKFCSKCGNRI
jgi:TM2 domain-containing membrane protein YozV